MSSGIPTSIGKYQIIREIARSNDIVYEAYEPSLNRRVALKELAMPGGATSQQREDRARRFEREAKAVGGLSHPNIVTVYEYSSEGDRNYIAMEYLEGHTLRNELDTHGFLPVDRAISIAKEVLDALDYAHKHGVVHRDIKPENIQLLPDGRIKLTDFGIARLTFEPNLTMDGQVFGTPSYMSPEQIVGREIDARSDLFSVGVVLYEMIAGEKPFSGDSVVSTTYAIMNLQPPQPKQANHVLWQVISTAIDKSAALRYANALEMYRALEAAARASTSLVLDPGVDPTQSIGHPAAPPVGNPYIQTTYAGQAPITYPFNPYAQPQQGQPSQSPQGFPQLPIYYPPPPRGPLVSPETKHFLAKLFLTVLVLGTLFALVVVVINGLGTAWMRSRAQFRDSEIRSRLERQDASLPLEDRIQNRESAIGRLQDPASRGAERRNLAVLYEKRGKEQLAAGKWTEAESSFKQALDLDPTNAAYASDLGDLYSREAAFQTESESRQRLLEESITHWARAFQYERDPVRKRQVGAAAAAAYVAFAQELRAAGDSQKARDVLYAARDLVAPESVLGRTIEDLLIELTR